MRQIATNSKIINLTISKITSNVSGLHTLIKRQRLSDCIKKQDPAVSLLIRSLR